MEISRRNAFQGNFLEVCFRTPGTSQKLLQKSALRCIRLFSVLKISSLKIHGKLCGSVTLAFCFLAHRHAVYQCLKNSDLPFLAFLEFLAFFLFKEFLAFSAFLPSSIGKGRLSIKSPCFFGGFPCRFPKKQGKEDQGSFRHFFDTLAFLKR